MPPADPAPAPDSHEPAGRVDVPGAAPEWAVEMAREFGRDFFFPDDVPDLARLLATLRERTLREAAGVSAPFPGVVHSIANPCDACQIAYTTGSLDAASALHNAILSLIAQPPKPERSDGSEAEGREEA